MSYDTYGDYSNYDYTNTNGQANPGNTADMCHEYPVASNGFCSEYLRDKIVHIGTVEGIQGIENQIEAVLTQMNQFGSISPECGRKAPEAFCHYLLPTCLADNSKQQLCRSDCELLRYSNCDKEFEQIRSLPDTHLMKQYDSQFKCDTLPEIDEQCTSIGLPPVLKKSDQCYRETGIGERELHDPWYK